jgi:fumarylpyruvate hydrolase
MTYAFPPAPVTTLPITNSTQDFPVSRIYCVGRNYAEHTREMGGDPNREAPFFFSKPKDAIVPSGSKIAYPQATSNLHFEMELVIAIGKEGKDLSSEEAQAHIFGYACGIDLTRRDLQGEAKEKGRPWDTGKGFDNSAPCSAVTPANLVDDLENMKIWLDVNGKRMQEAKISDMIWNSFEILAHLSHFYTIKPGDLIFTGTPAGVGKLEPGDQVDGGVDGLNTISITIV